MRLSQAQYCLAAGEPVTVVVERVRHTVRVVRIGPLPKQPRLGHVRIGVLCAFPSGREMWANASALCRFGEPSPKLADALFVIRKLAADVTLSEKGRSYAQKALRELGANTGG